MDTFAHILTKRFLAYVWFSAVGTILCLRLYVT